MPLDAPARIPPHNLNGRTLCGCGCGQLAPIARRSDSKWGWIKGEAKRFISGHQMRGRTRSENHNWRGGRSTWADGYVRVRVPEHPRASNGYVFEHILIVERALGHYLPPSARVHHRNEQRSDNRPENLLACEDTAYHRLIHERVEAFRATGTPDARRCKFCHEWAKPSDPAVRSQSRGRGYRLLFHVQCRRQAERARYAVRIA